MTLSKAVALQTAVYERLMAALATAGPGGAAIPVYDHVPQDPDRYHVRLDGFDVYDRSPRSGLRLGEHVFEAHVFDRPGETGGRGQLEVKRILALIDAALARWRPIAGDGLIELDNSTIDPEPDGATMHGRATYTVWLGD